MSSILIQDVSKTFETKDGSVQALKHVSLSIETGDIYGIIGMSGAGKSTLVRCMNFLEVPSEGKVLIDGKSLSEFSPKELRKEREKIGMIFQHFNLLMQKNVLENVCFPLYIQGKKKAEARAKALELLEIVGLADRAKAYPAQLSGGQKQRVAIARALASDPQILLCDEATSALDPQTTSSILELLQDINQKFGITIVIITHQMSVVREICTHVAIMKDGEVKEQGHQNNGKDQANRSCKFCCCASPPVFFFLCFSKNMPLNKCHRYIQHKCHSSTQHKWQKKSPRNFHILQHHIQILHSQIQKH